MQRVVIRRIRGPPVKRWATTGPPRRLMVRTRSLRAPRPRAGKPTNVHALLAIGVVIALLASFVVPAQIVAGPSGPRGAQGGAGPSGAAGAGGLAGVDGFQALVDVQAESAGANCAAAGKKVYTGLDNGDGGGTARNGVLEPGERDTGPDYVCNGATGTAGANGYNTLVDVQTEAPGANCAAGGQVVYWGLDNGDGGATANDNVLAVSERDGGPKYACNGATGSSGAAGRDAGLKYTYNTGLSGDPGSGKFGFDTATLSAIATFRISETDGDSNAMATWIATWDDSTTTNPTATITVLGDGAPTRFLIFKITGTLTDNGAYDSFPVSYITSGGSHANNDVDKMFEDRTGDKGATGTTGTNGFSTLMKFTAEAAGANCPSGGNKVDTGLDNGDGGGTANNGVLEAGEIDVTNYLCVPNVGGKMVFFTAFAGSTPSTATQWTNMPAALTELLGLTSIRVQTNLTGFTGVRFGVGIQVASAANAFLLLQYSTNNASTWLNACGSTCPEVNIGAAASKWTAWQTMNSTMAADVLLRVVGQNGDGAADPTFDEIYCEFR